MDLCSFCSAPVISLAVVVVPVSLYFLFGRKSAKKLDPTLPKGTVLLHMFPRGPKAPNLSPLPIKLEMFLRVNKIPYKCDYKDFMSSKGKCPWMQFNGEATADSQFCIERLKRELNIDMNGHLSLEEKAVSRAFVALIEDCLYWPLACSRWTRTPERTLKAFRFPKLLAFIMKFVLVPSMKKQSWAQGIGRHSREEQWQIFTGCVDALSSFLGEKPYLMGDKISEVDCTLFGSMVQIVYHDLEDEVHKDYVKLHCPNLIDFVKRIKNEFWAETKYFKEE